MNRIKPVILSGGAGTRLWPLSNAAVPKQFRALTDDATMFQMTLRRTAADGLFAPPMIVAGTAHQQIIEAQLKEASVADAQLLLEPCARNTAPAIALAALACDTPDTAMLVMPSDHVIADVAAFHRAIAAARPHVAAGWMVTFGIEATSAETGYGYIQAGADIGGTVRQVARFVEKPDLAGAQAMLKDGGYAWNGGIFLFRADAYLAALEKYAPAILNAAKTAYDGGTTDGQVIIPDADCFAACPADSIDYAVMEKAASAADGKVAVVPAAMGWSDVGSWDALCDIAPVNHAVADVDGSGNYVRSDAVRIHLAGVENMIIVAAGQDIIITPRGQSQNVKSIVEQLKRDGKL